MLKIPGLLYNACLLAIKKFGGFSLIERVILSAGAMLIFSVYFLLTICPEGRKDILKSSL
ncbi:hypothetical protein N7491_003223 [Penicillium cf. griseofulvum]|uniref:Uncharacterized protein n=1 Tax=Penicillium cf. griseofulvum TaxID=2972120 RepID=A0A9W9MRJ4_9EURO|nr:hypothetical protein N7472_002605 [Penicillium cf. griseofulvum]KAJ5440817.1 hypothetical protein N7491_003223 [Penicillium cf. griseofulvum]KAJ5448863.1 hypothetical protein N7445_003684 [Penicillium cf. griseofulvum]